MSTDRYATFVDRQSGKVNRTRELKRFRRRLRWWGLSLLAATVLFTILMVVGELT